jgi:predicted nucleic acid-binding protein
VITFDTGALIALERRSQRMWRRFQAAKMEGLTMTMTVPAAVVIDWWRGRSDIREDILGSVRVEPLTDALAKIAGEALAATRGASAIDAVVMASAASRGDVVFTSDVSDLVRLRAYFPTVRVLAS